MGSLREPTLGPIVGHTTDHFGRLWIRTGDPADAGATLSQDRRTIGVLTVLNKNKADPEHLFWRLTHRWVLVTNLFY
jgi:alkaline phosphatase D